MASWVLVFFFCYCQFGSVLGRLVWKREVGGLVADLLTHIGTGLLFKAGTGGRHTAVFVLGNALPDLMRSIPVMGVDRLIRFAHIPVPKEAMYPWAVLHMPIGMLFSSYLLCWLFAQKVRYRVCAWLFAGMSLHLTMDLFQDHHGQGYFLLYPFSNWTFEFGLYGPEETVQFGPWLFGISIVAWCVRFWYEDGISFNDKLKKSSDK